MKCFNTSYQGAQMVWREFGSSSAEPLVLLHGGHGSWQHWMRNIQELSQHYRLLIPNLPGYGDSDSPAEPTLSALVNATCAGLDELLGQHAPVRLAGFSFGGLVAALIAAQRSHVSHLLLLGPAGLGSTRRPKGKLLAWQATQSAHDEQALRDIMRHNLLMHMLAHESSIDPQALDIHTAACLQTRFHSKKISRADGLALALRRALELNPGLIGAAIWGEHDVTCTPGAVLELLQNQGLSAQRALVVANAGHWVQYEASTIVDQHMLALLA
jgi:pimeloyl-ACP methyl ester carboxylesterase